MKIHLKMIKKQLQKCRNIILINLFWKSKSLAQDLRKPNESQSIKTKEMRLWQDLFKPNEKLIIKPQKMRLWQDLFKLNEKLIIRNQYKINPFTGLNS